jgi:flavin-dependent dehydrogenase
MGRDDFQDVSITMNAEARKFDVGLAPMPDVCRTDLLVVGAGPAGCCAAIAAARSGLDVLVCDAARFPRHRPGETIAQETAELLGRFIGPRFQTVPALSFESIERSSSHGVDVALVSGLHIHREALETSMHEAVIGAGARLRLSSVCGSALASPFGWRVSLGNRAVDARFVIDATGQSQWLHKALGIRSIALSKQLTAHYWYSARLRESGGNSPCFLLTKNGWRWETPIDAQTRVTCEMGLGDDATSPNVAGARRCDVSWRIADALACRNFAIAGDSAARVDPSSANGVERAVRSGIDAGLLAARCCAGGRPDEAILNYARSVTARVLRDCSLLHRAYRASSSAEDPVGFNRLAGQFMKDAT